ncbi:GNAT family N-acetyltransferase [Serinibacter arcticus]|uniref:Nodulation protein A n=1 Tax=Serinibacter arcticus TaxID=1655435 RepID=A0A4Z1E190_9MICO|nr:GNAT family N-acetyltransferase [Serinibacter arcticus]TGO05694.1 Nodulation protein A [Serinibacter arcticus]
MTTWRTVRETDLTAADHTALAGLLARAFPETDLRGRSWCSERPELRLVGTDDDGAPAAHLAVLRRFVRVGTAEVLVADTGLVAVDPSRQGTGLGLALLTEAARVLAGLGVPFGFLTTGHDREGFYSRGGWRRTPTQLTRTIERDESVQVWREASLHLPLGRGEFPSGEITRDGYEV